MVLFTCGSGEAGVQAIQSEKHILMLTISPQHAELVAFFIDCENARLIQVLRASILLRLLDEYAWYSD